MYCTLFETVKKGTLAVTYLVQFSDVLLLPLLQQLCNLVITLHLSSCRPGNKDKNKCSQVNVIVKLGL